MFLCQFVVLYYQDNNDNFLKEKEDMKKKLSTLGFSWERASVIQNLVVN
jgi:virulence-associated protein VapD